ncbi:MAG: hypothetical protein LBR39_03885 [Coriobacteriales bacterium]|jgi:hypothetical protein|nr:hypothetical protein [Coriobacteriales bacterium]
MSNVNQSTNGETKTPAKAWVMLVIVFIYCIATAMLWFSVPPMAQAIIPSYIIQLGQENIQSNFGALSR